jgi:hypothetical protein
MNPGCWWDCGGFRTILSSIDSTVFNRSQYFYLKGADTVFVYWAAFSDSSLLKLGIENKENVTSSLRVFPNPATDVITITLNKIVGDIDGIEIYNSLGQMVLTSKQLINVDISTLKTGIYIIKVRNKSGFILTTKFQKVL